MSYRENEIQVKIDELKFKLRNTDYQAIKFAEGAINESEFYSIREQRKSWRDEINRLETQLRAEIEALKNG